MVNTYVELDADLEIHVPLVPRIGHHLESTQKDFFRIFMKNIFFNYRVLVNLT
jgi:hypothetical protein